MDDYNHGEAFMLMNYATKDGSENEVIWNSRDGVTPFIVHSRRDVEMHHVDWQKDRRAPNHKPHPGDRIFVDSTEELIGGSLDRYIAQFWDKGDYPMNLMFESKEEARAELLKDWLKPGAPCLVVVQPDGSYKHEGDD